MKNKQRKNTYDKIMQNGQDPKKRNTKCSRSTIEINTLSFNQKERMYFDSNDLMSYEKQAKKILSILKLRSTSTGISNKKLIFSGLALLMFCGFGHLVTGSTSQAVNLDQVIRTTRNQVDSIEYSPDQISDSANKSALSSSETEIVNIDSAEEQQALDQKQTTEVNPAKSPRLNQLPTDSTDITDSTKVQPELNQSQSTTTEEIATTVQPANTIEGVDETHSNYRCTRRTNRTKQRPNIICYTGIN